MNEAVPRDALWNHPDFAPTAQELQDPEAFLASRAKKAEADADIDAALEQMLEGTLGWAEGLQPGQDSEGDAKRARNSGDSDGSAGSDGADGSSGADGTGGAEGSSGSSGADGSGGADGTDGAGGSGD